jgi:hypothetical protein
MKKRKSLILGKEENLLNRFSYIFLRTYTLNAPKVNVLYLLVANPCDARMIS